MMITISNALTFSLTTFQQEGRWGQRCSGMGWLGCNTMNNAINVTVDNTAHSVANDTVRYQRRNLLLLSLLA